MKTIHKNKKKSLDLKMRVDGKEVLRILKLKIRN